jgi:hypothetical protein
VLRKLDEGVDVGFDEEKGIIDKETGEVLIDIALMYYDGDDKEDNEIITSEKDTKENKEYNIEDNNFEEDEEDDREDDCAEEEKKD